jgi:hypothetical protein
MSQPYEIFGSQNLSDDDGPVIDSLFIETDSPPDMKAATEPIPATSQKQPISCGRLLTGSLSMTLAVFTSPTQILPADPNRKSLVLTAFSSAASPTALVEYIEISDENGKVAGSSGFNLRPGKDPITLTDYTGALWAMPASTITAAIELSWVAVTA